MNSKINPGWDTSTLELLRAMQLACPSLPLGAFAYSQGLEYAVESGWVHDAASAQSWITGLFEYSVGRFDLPLLCRLLRAFNDADLEAVRYHNQWLLAGRESAELQAEELHLGAALYKLLSDLGLLDTRSLDSILPLGYVSAFALSAWRFDLSEQVALTSYSFAWLEHQTSAVTRLVPLGQTAAQSLLSYALGRVSAVLTTARELSDDEVGAVAPGQALASALHETQYTRLFRS